MPAATATGLPDSVPAWYTGPIGAIFCIRSARPPKAATGMPPPITLPSAVRSGVMPYMPWAPSRPTRKPHITSSKISTAPCSVHSSRMRCRNSGVARIRFILPATGSTITQAMVSPIEAKASSSCGTLL